ncbi:MAG: peptidoglycan DD-metalloendopeptidase family protein [Burkholderiaceae bacterium]
MANQSAGVLAIDVVSFIRKPFAAAALLALLAGCASQPPAPIVHRAPPIRGQAPTPPAVESAGAPIVSAPSSLPGAAPGAAGAPVAAETPPGAALPSAQPSPVPGAPVQPGVAPGAPEAPLVVETVPIRPSSVESRPLPGAAAPPLPPAPPTPGSVIAAPAMPSSNLLKTTPKAVKQPYSDALFAELKGAAAPGAAAPASTPQGSAQQGSAAPGSGSPAAGSPAPAAPVASAPSGPVASAPPSAAAAEAGAGGFIWPAGGRVLQPFSEPRSMGMAIEGRPGDPIVAANDGRVIFAGPGPRGYGNLLIVKHDANTLSVYAHNRALLVKEGQNVKRGQRIAELGSSGTDRPKLHFEIRKQGKPVDPQKFLPVR